MIKKNKAGYMITYIFICSCLTGCLASISAYPDRSYDPKKELTAMEDYLSETAITNYNASNNDARGGMSKRNWRNAVINARVRAIDLHFSDFQQNLFQEGVGLGIGTDWLVLALSGLGSVYGSASKALSAASTGVVGAKASFDKNAFFDKTMPTLLASMTAKRKEVLVTIRAGLTKDIDEYPLNLALNDLDTYYNAGTIPGSLVEIAEDSGAKAKKADEDLKEILTSKYKKDNSGDIIRKFWKPNGSEINRTNQAVIRAWMEENELGNVSITFFMRSEKYSAAREKAVQDLQLN